METHWYPVVRDYDRRANRTGSRISTCGTLSAVKAHLTREMKGNSFLVRVAIHLPDGSWVERGRTDSRWTAEPAKVETAPSTEESVNQPDKPEVCRNYGKPFERMPCGPGGNDQRAADPCAGCFHTANAIALEAELKALRGALVNIVRQAWPTGWKAKVQHAAEDYREHGQLAEARALDHALGEP